MGRYDTKKAKINWVRSFSRDIGTGGCTLGELRSFLDEIKDKVSDDAFVVIEDANGVAKDRAGELLDVTRLGVEHDAITDDVVVVLQSRFPK